MAANIYQFPAAKRKLLSSFPSGSPGSNKVNLTGYLLLAGERQMSNTKHPMFDVHIRTNATTIAMVRVMELNLSVKQFFKRNIGNVVHLEKVANKTGLYFYNETYGAKKFVQENVLPFNNNVLYNNMSNITEETAGPVNCEGYLVPWSGATWDIFKGFFWYNFGN